MASPDDGLSGRWQAEREPRRHTGSKRPEALSQSISKLEGSFSSSEYYPLAVRTMTIFTQPFDSYPKSLAMTLCMRNGSTVSLTQRKLHLRRSHPTHAHVTNMCFAHYYSRICNLIGGRGSPASAKKTAHSPQTHLPCLIKWRPEVGMGTRLPQMQPTSGRHLVEAAPSTRWRPEVGWGRD